MNQSSFIAAVLLAGFVLYLAAKNRLGAYTAVFFGPTQAPLPTWSAASAGSTAQTALGLPIPGFSSMQFSPADIASAATAFGVP